MQNEKQGHNRKSDIKQLKQKKPREKLEESKGKTEVSQICEVLQDDLEEKRFKTTLKYIFKTK